MLVLLFFNISMTLESTKRERERETDRRERDRQTDRQTDIQRVLIISYTLPVTSKLFTAVGKVKEQEKRDRALQIISINTNTY